VANKGEGHNNFQGGFDHQGGLNGRLCFQGSDSSKEGQGLSGAQGVLPIRF